MRLSVSLLHKDEHAIELPSYIAIKPNIISSCDMYRDILDIFLNMR